MELSFSFRTFATESSSNKYRMKTKEEITAEIAQGVREAARQRAETEIVRESALRTELGKEVRDSKKARKDKRASFYYKVSYLFLTCSGVSGFSTLMSKDDPNWYFIGASVSIALAFAILADKTLKP